MACDHVLSQLFREVEFATLQQPWEWLRVLEVAVWFEEDLDLVLRWEPSRQVEPLVVRALQVVQRLARPDLLRQNRLPAQFLLLVEQVEPEEKVVRELERLD